MLKLRFVGLYMKQVKRNLVFRISDQVRNKLGRTAIVDGWTGLTLWIQVAEEFVVLQNDNKGTDQLHKYWCTWAACFFLLFFSQNRFSHDPAHMG